MDKVSVIVPVYNLKRYLDENLRAALIDLRDKAQRVSDYDYYQRAMVALTVRDVLTKEEESRGN